MMAALHHVVRRPSAGQGNPPVLILLHGVGSNEGDIAALAPAMDSRFLVVSVRSPITLGPDAYAWFNVRFSAQGPVINAQEAQAGWETLAKFIQDVVAEHGGDASQVYVAGFSQGGIMALAALLATPELVAGAVCMSGRLLPEVLPHAAPRERLAGKPVLLVHGTADSKLVIEHARKAKSTLEGLGAELAYHELPMGHEITSASLGLVVDWLAGHLGARAKGSSNLA
jgi:phospholipase/carboxylesterase